MDELERRVEQTAIERLHVESALAERGLEHDSQANFSWVSLGERDEDELVGALRARRDRDGRRALGQRGGCA